MGGVITYIKKTFLVAIILFLSIFTVQLQAEEPTEEPVEEPEVTILAVKQDGFTREDMLNFRTVGSTRHSGNGISIVQNQESSAGSFFTANRIFMDESENAGFSTYFEMSTSGGNGLGFADGFTFIVSQFTNVLGSSGGAIGYGGIRNSVAILFDSWDNGGQPPLCISLGLEGRQLACSNSVTSNGGTYYIWIDYSKVSRTIEVRLRRTAGDRPLNPTISYNNIDLTNNIGNEFYAGFTSATGGATQNTFLSRWYFSASFSPNGIDPRGNYEVEVARPLKPSVEVTYYDEDKKGWFFVPTRNENESFAEVGFLYSINNAGSQSYDESVFVPDGTRELRVFTRSPGGIVSEPSDTLRFNRGLFYMNYPDAINETRSFPATGSYELYEPLRKGYDFLGWTKKIAFNENEVIETSQFPVDQVFIGHWELRQFDINFQTFSDTVIPSINTNINDGFELPNNPSKPFNTFLGWFIDEELEQPFDMDTFNYEDVTLYAKWEVATYDVSTYYSETPDIVRFEHGSIISKPNDPERINFFFDGFYTSTSYTIPYTFNQQVTKDENIYVKWVDAIPVLRFMSGIDDLPKDLMLTDAHKEILKDLREQHESLSSDQLRFLDPEFEAKLSLYETWMEDLIAANIVSVAIGDLPWIPTIEDKELIDAVIESYEALTETQKTYITEQAVHKMFDVSKQNARLIIAKALDVELDEIPIKLTYDDLEKMQALIVKYNALPDLERALISPINQSKINLALSLQEDSIHVNTFVNKVNALVTIDETKLLELIGDYDLLTENQKALVPDVIKNRLMLVSKYHQDKAEANALDSIVSTLNTNNPVAVESAIKSFKALSKDQVNLLSQQTKNTLIQAGLVVDDPLRVKTFVEKVDAQITIDENMLEELLNDYDALSQTQKNEVPDVILNRLMLVSKYHQDKAEALKLDNLLQTLNLNNQEAIDQVLAMYNTLSQDQINLLSESSKNKLEAAGFKLNDPERLTSFVDKVNALATIDKDMLEELLKEYDQLSESQRAEVPLIITKRLMLASKYHQDMVETAKLEEVLKNLRRNDEDALNLVMELYNTLSEDQINLLSASSRKTLDEVIERYNREEGIFGGNNGSYFPWLAVVVTLTFISGSYFFYKLKHIGL
jgi:enamine deaminase RidA (YjgF/YER057c/UK114 family)